jgi:hypothetical protein
MRTSITAISLWSWIVLLGTSFGAGIYEHRIVTPRWLVQSTDSDREWRAAVAREDNVGLRFWAFVSTGPLTLLTLANLAAAWGSSGPARTWWLAAAGIAATERALTFAYFIPTMVGLMEMTDSAASVGTATRWLHVNHIRHALVLTAWLLAMRTSCLTCSSQNGELGGAADLSKNGRGGRTCITSSATHSANC